MAVFAGHSHPLTGRSRLMPADLASYPALLPPEDSTTYALIDAALGEHGLRITPRMTSPYLETLQMLAGTGIGWTVLPDAMHDAHVQRLRLPDLNLARRLGAVRHPKRSLSNAAAALLAMLESTSDSAGEKPTASVFDAG